MVKLEKLQGLILDITIVHFHSISFYSVYRHKDRVSGDDEAHDEPQCSGAYTDRDRHRTVQIGAVPTYKVVTSRANIKYCIK
jgi:hypothetical protein